MKKVLLVLAVAPILVTGIGCSCLNNYSGAKPGQVGANVENRQSDNGAELAQSLALETTRVDPFSVRESFIVHVNAAASLPVQIDAVEIFVEDRRVAHLGFSGTSGEIRRYFELTPVLSPGINNVNILYRFGQDVGTGSQLKIGRRYEADGFNASVHECFETGDDVSEKREAYVLDYQPSER